MKQNDILFSSFEQGKNHADPVKKPSKTKINCNTQRMFYIIEENMVHTVYRTTGWGHLCPQTHTSPEWVLLRAGKPCKALAEAWEDPQKP